MEPILEEWRPVVGYEGLYVVSNLGKVMSLSRRVANNWPGSTRVIKGKTLKPTKFQNGYYFVSLGKEGVLTKRTVHSVVAEAFIGPRPERMDICHNNGDRSDNRLSNLRYDTRKGNFEDTLHHGTKLRGEKQNGAVLTEDDVWTIRESEEHPRVLAARYGVSAATIYDIRKRRSWKHLPVKKPLR